MNSDIVTRLRRWTHAVDAAPASDLMDEAADEIERLRLELFIRPTPNILVQSPQPTLTDSEREAVEWAVRAMRPECRAVLQGLLDRTK